MLNNWLAPIIASASLLGATTLGVCAAWTGASSTPTSTRRAALQQVLIQGPTTAVAAAFMTSVAALPVPAALAKNLPDRPSVDTSNAGTAQTLEPVLALLESLQRLRADVAASQISPASLILESTGIPTTEMAFKSIFDAYSDPVSYKQRFVDQNAFLVYYTKGFDGLGRDSIESDLPVRQTIQYGARNDAWVAWEEFMVEIDYQQQEQNPRDADKEDLLQPLTTAIRAIDGYLKASGVEPSRQ